eukprot:TCALIF_13590-PA protein Name:"Similar to Esterase FE4 (Myzus persicae)" AED:0.44 eAED:0.44 QI:0/0/0/0.5/1/1/2/0/254
MPTDKKIIPNTLGLITMPAVCFILALTLIGEVQRVIVDTQHGPVLGTIETSFEGHDFFGIHSIPYAQPPIGDLRCRDPLPFGDWEGVLNGTEDGPECIQIPALIETGTIGQEDCLWLSVYTPSLVPDSNLPVVVWIHGGRWLVGSGRQSSYGPHQLIDRSVVVVQIQYRLGALGWLSTEDSVAPGNYAFKDQVPALKWVKANIHAFRGEPRTNHSFGTECRGRQCPCSYYLSYEQGVVPTCHLHEWNSQKPIMI